MNYYFNKTIKGTFEEVIDKVTQGLKNEEGVIEVAAVDPLASMQAVNNKQLMEIADEITAKLENVIENI